MNNDNLHVIIRAQMPWVVIGYHCRNADGQTMLIEKHQPESKTISDVDIWGGETLAEQNRR
jgi:hypothetical protein